MHTNLNDLRSRLRVRIEPDPPADPEAERNLFVAVAVDSARTREAVRPIVDADDFSDPLHARLFATAAAIIDAGEPIATILRRLKPDTRRYLGRITAACPPMSLPGDAVALAHRIRAAADRRLFIVAAEMAAERAYDGNGDIPSMIDELAAIDRGARPVSNSQTQQVA